MRTLGGLAIIAVGTLLLTGCMASQPAATGSPVETAEAKPSSTGKATASWPKQLVDTSCERLVPQAQLDALYGVPLEPGKDDDGGDGRRGLWNAAVENSGSIRCVWGAPNPGGTIGEGNNWYGVTVTIFPHAVAIHDQIFESLAASTDHEPRVGCDWGFCSSENIIDDFWVESYVLGTGDLHGDVPVGVQAVFDSVTTVVEGLGSAPDPVWPAEASTWPSSCEQFVSTTTLAEALDLPGASFTDAYSVSGGNIAYGMVLGARGLVCGIAREGGGRSGSIAVLPAAGSGFSAAYSQAILSEEVEAVDIAGLEPGSAFVRRPVSTPSNATLEMNLRGTWVVLSMGVVPGSGGPDAASRLISLAEALAAQS